MARRSDIVVAGGVVGHHQHSIQVASGQQSVSAVVNGMAVSWSGQPMSVTTTPVVQPTASGVEVLTAIERVVSFRMLGMASVTSGVTMATASTIAVFLLGAPIFVLAAWAPAALLLTAGGFMAFRRGPSAGGVSEGQILESAHRHGGTLTIARLALDTGRSMADCQKQLDAMVAAGWVTVDVDDDGLLTYRIASLGSR